MASVLGAFDKFKGTATSKQLGLAACRGARRAGWGCRPVALSDGGEGFLEALASPSDKLQVAKVEDALGREVEVKWLLRLIPGVHFGIEAGADTPGKLSFTAPVAFIESASAIGLDVLGGPERNDPVAASTRGVGQLVLAALEAGARTVVVGIGGSSTTDGGKGAVDVLMPARQAGALEAVRLVGAYDVRSTFADAARIFAPQKGASPEQVSLLDERLAAIAGEYEHTFGVDVTALAGSGAGGGLAGGLAALGGALVPGAQMVASAVDLGSNIQAADVVVTGEGRYDHTSAEGKLPALVQAMAGQRRVPVVVIAGEVEQLPTKITRALRGQLGCLDGTLVSLTEQFGAARSLQDPLSCVEEVMAELLEGLGLITCR